MTLTNNQVLALNALQTMCGDNSKAKGFHEDRPTRDLFIKGERGDRAYLSCLNDWHSNKYMLIVSEAAEAHDEVRNGHAPDETYFPTQGTGEGLGRPMKPEGVPSEIADIVIRAFDYAYLAGFSIADIINVKMTYNATRAYKHGKKF